LFTVLYACAGSSSACPVVAVGPYFSPSDNTANARSHGLPTTSLADWPWPAVFSLILHSVLRRSYISRGGEASNNPSFAVNLNYNLAPSRVKTGRNRCTDAQE